VGCPRRDVEGLFGDDFKIEAFGAQFARALLGFSIEDVRPTTSEAGLPAFEQPRIRVNNSRVAGG
jgi:hypothetical protein